jgi:hypothetical protein
VSNMSLQAKKICRRIAGRAITTAVLVTVTVLTISCGSAKPAHTASPSGTTPAPSATTSTSPEPAQSSASGTAPPQTTQPVSTPPAQTTPAGSTSCATSELRVWLGRGEGAAGSSYYAMEFKNVSSQVRWLRSAYGDGHQIGSPAGRDTPKPVRTVTLEPGVTAHGVLRISNVGSYDPSACMPVTASSIKVYPPNQTTATYIPLGFGACSTKRTPFMDVWPIQAAAIP